MYPNHLRHPLLCDRRLSKNVTKMTFFIRKVTSLAVFGDTPRVAGGLQPSDRWRRPAATPPDIKPRARRSRFAAPRAPRRHEQDSRVRQDKPSINGVDAAEELCGNILPPLVCPDRVSAKRMAVPLLAGSMNILDRPADRKPFTAKAPAGFRVHCAVHELLPRWPLAVASPSRRAPTAAASRSMSKAAWNSACSTVPGTI